MIVAGNGMAYPIMVVGNDRIAYSVVCGLLANEHTALLLTNDEAGAIDFLEKEIGTHDKLQIMTEWPDRINSHLIVLITPDQIDVKAAQIRLIEERASHTAIVAVNLESLHLDELQSKCLRPSQLLGLNWAYPVQNTYFAEIIANTNSDKQASAQLQHWLTQYWKKDPCITHRGFSIRARMMAAMLREGLSLVENDFASIESVDRACRNDAGYYLPFAGNFRYMDLMGTYAYGMVMKDLNRELSNDTELSPILVEKKTNGDIGMEVGKGFYSYTREDTLHWEELFREFSQEIQQLIKKYPHETFDS